MAITSSISKKVSSPKADIMASVKEAETVERTVTEEHTVTVEPTEPKETKAPAVKKPQAPLMRLSDAFKMISGVLVSNDPEVMAPQMIDCIRDIVSATGYASAYEPVGDPE